jgi:hypothetical protein
MRFVAWHASETEWFLNDRLSAMRNLIFKAIALFFVLLVATTILMDALQMEFGTVNFWQKRGVFFLFFIAIFPRLTLLFSSVATGGFLWWLGFIFCPRILVAALATVAYFHTNPILVVISWLMALGGEVFEKWKIGSNGIVVKTYRRGPTATYPNEQIHQGDAIEAEFTKK